VVLIEIGRNCVEMPRSSGEDVGNVEGRSKKEESPKRWLRIHGVVVTIVKDSGRIEEGSDRIEGFLFESLSAKFKVCWHRGWGQARAEVPIPFPV
jgi:hypothetical protein